MGVPVLTLKGFNLNSRCGESINNNLNLEEFVAENFDDYFNKSISLQNKDKLSKLRSSLRKKVLSSPLFDTDNFTKELMSIFTRLVN